MRDLQIVRIHDDEPNPDALGLARDLCTGVASFFASADGYVVTSLAPGHERSELNDHVRALASRSLSHPLAQGRHFFTNAEAGPEGRADDESLACIATPVWEDDRWVGVIGVADSWLPDLDEEQKQGLHRIGSIVARRLDEGTRRNRDSSTPEESRTTFERGPLGRNDDTLGPARRWSDQQSPIILPALELDEVADFLPEALVVARQDGTIAFVNHTFAELYGADASSIRGLEASDLFTSDDKLIVKATQQGELVRYLIGTSSPGRRLVLLTWAGERVPVDVSGRAVTLGGLGEGYIVQVRDARRPGEGQLGGVGEWSLETALDALDEGIVVCDTDGIVRFVNQAGRELQGIDDEGDLLGHPFPTMTGLYSSGDHLLSWEQHPLARALRGTVIRGEHLQRGPSGPTSRHILASAQPLDVSASRGAMLVLRDITTQTIEEARLTHLALHDPLTGLANRHLLLDHLRRVLGDSRNRGGIVALVFIDLDAFKIINDEYGHDVGDEVLVAVGRRLQGAVRSSDVVARLGGDEFVIAHSASTDPDEPYQVVSRIQKTLSVPYQVRGHTLVVTCSIGWVVADPINDDPIDLLVRADREMYRSKRSRARTDPTR